MKTPTSQRCKSEAISISPWTHVAALTLFARATSKATRKAALLTFSVALLLAGAAAAVHGQSALDGFDPIVGDFVIVTVVQPDGRILLGGQFNGANSINGQTRNYIARLNPDGTLDTGFDPNANSQVYSMAVQADGKIVVGGNFTFIGGQTRNHIARLDPTTGLADSFNPNANTNILSIAVQADGKIVVGGDFTSIGGQTRNRIARLDPTTGLADSFNPNANSNVQYNSIVVQADGKIVVGGDFTSIGGQTRNYIARLDPTTGLADSFNPNANNGVNSIAVQADGKIVVGGGFTNIGGQTRNYIARLDPTTGLADSFDPNASLVVGFIAVQADGMILAGGPFTSIGGQTRNRIARLDPMTGLADSFNPNANGNVAQIVVQQDGKILLGGNFFLIGGQSHTYIARLETDGRADQTLNLNVVDRPSGIPPPGNGPLGSNPFVFATAVQPDGKILFGGKFSSVLGVTRNNIARLKTDNTVDMDFDPNANGVVNAIVVEANGKILIGGAFTTLGPNGEQMRNYIAQLDATTGMADSFNPNANGVVNAIGVQANGKILVGGEFNQGNGAPTIGGQTRNYIAQLDPMTGMADSSFNPNANGKILSIGVVQANGKILAGGDFTTLSPNGGAAVTRNHIAQLNPDGTLDTAFNPNANGKILSIAVVQANGEILAGGDFTTLSPNGGAAVTRNHIAQLNPDGTLDTAFNPNANGKILSIGVQANGKILVGGAFSGANSIGGHMRNYIARLDPMTGLADDSFDPNADGEVDSIAVQTDGKVLAGGSFTNIGGQARNVFARLTNDTAALQNLDVTTTTATWTRDGSSPQLTRVTFEWSGDNVTYNLLGNGTATGSNWTLTGFYLSPGNTYVRARGYYSSGLGNGSASITESVEAFVKVRVSGAISYCAGSARPVPNVTLRLSGNTGALALSESSGNYQLSFVPNGGDYTVTPSKSNLPAGGGNTPGIDTADAGAVQRHFLGQGTPLSGCALQASRTSPDNTGPGPDTRDANAIQRFYLEIAGTGNTGQWRFNPPSVSYNGINSDQTAQNYGAYALGDVTGDLVFPSSAPDQSVSEPVRKSTPVEVSVALPKIGISAGNFAAAVAVSEIDSGEKLVAFQGDFTFDSSVISFQNPPVARAGLTANGNWALAANALGTGKIKTLRVSCYALDATSVLSGKGPLFELRMSRVSNKRGASTALVWSAEPNNFIFIDTSSQRRAPSNTLPGKITVQEIRKR